jgi:hypothetical protein
MSRGRRSRYTAEPASPWLYTLTRTRRMASESLVSKVRSTESLGRVLGSKKQSPTCVVDVCKRESGKLSLFLVPACVGQSIAKVSGRRSRVLGFGSWALPMLPPFSSLLYLKSSSFFSFLPVSLFYALSPSPLLLSSPCIPRTQCRVSSTVTSCLSSFALGM